MRALLASTLGVIALGAPLLTTVDAAAGPFAKRTSLKAVIFEDVKPLYQKSGDTYEGFGVDTLDLIKDQAGRRTLKFIPTTSAEDGMNAITSGKADIACGVAFDWGRAEKVSYTIPFAIGVIALGAIKLWWASVLMDLKTFTMLIDASAMDVDPMPWRCEASKRYIAIKCRFTASL